jgi:serine phosphatase RsbU (regulator of sigma subunit)
LNDAVLAASRDLFCTACYVTLAPIDGGWQLTSTAAGHPLPIVVSPDGSDVVGRPGTLLGMFEQIETATATAELRSGDVLVLYTDGMTDLPPPFGLSPGELNVLVGEARSQHSAEQLADALHRSLLERVPDRSRQDDVALLIARVR